MLDSIMRTPNTTTDELGGLPAPVSCDAPIDRGLNLSGLKLGLPSNFGWVNPGLSGEVSRPVPKLFLASKDMAPGSLSACCCKAILVI